MKSESYFDLLLRRSQAPHRISGELRWLPPRSDAHYVVQGYREGLLVPNRRIGKQSAQESRIAKIERMPARAWMKPLIIQINPRPYVLAAAIASSALGGTHASGGETSVAPADMRRIGKIDERLQSFQC